MTISRRTLLGSTLAAASLAALAGCGSGAPAGGGPLRFGFWGSDLRAKAFGEVVALFEQAHPGVDVLTEPGTFDAYFERLAVQTAGNDAPDVISMDIAYFSEYARRGALADLGEHAITTDGFPTSLVDSGRIDGQLMGLAHGMGACALLANPTVLEDLGIDLPEQTGWRWSELVDVAKEITSASGGRVVGLGGRTFLQALAFQSFLAERDQRTFTSEGTIGFGVDELAEWWQLALDAGAAGAVASPAAIVEESQLDVDRSGLAGGTVAIDTWWSNQLAAMNSAAGEQLSLVRLPSLEGSAPPVVLQPTVYWTVSSRSQQPDVAVELINFFTSEPAAAKIIMTDRGLPGSQTAREAIQDSLTEADRATADYVGDDANAAFTPFPPPVGGAELGGIYSRYATDVLFARTKPAAAAAAALDEIQSAIRT